MALSVVDTEVMEAADVNNTEGYRDGADSMIMAYWYLVGGWPIRARSVSRSGSTLSVGTASDDSEAAGSGNFEIGMGGRNQSKILKLHKDGSDNRGVIANPSWATSALLEASSGLNPGALSLTADGTKGAAIWRDTTGVDVTRICRLTSSGSSLSAGTPQDHSESPNPPKAMCALDNDKVGHLYAKSGNYWIQVIDVSSGISEGSGLDTGRLDDAVGGGNSLPGALVAPDATRMVAALRVNTALWLQSYSVSGSTVTLGEEIDMSSGADSLHVDVVGNVGAVAWSNSGTIKVETFDLTGTDITLNGDTLTVVSGLGVGSAVSCAVVGGGHLIVTVVDATAADLTAYLIGGAPSPPASAGQFYFGQGTLTYQFDLPFSGVNPKGMTLDQSLGTVVIGGKVESVDPVVYSQYPYLTGTPTDTGFPTGTSVSSIRWI